MTEIRSAALRGFTLTGAFRSSGLFLCWSALLLAAGHVRADTDLIQSGQITLNPSTGPVTLTLQGPAFDSAAADHYGLVLSYHDSTGTDPTASTVLRSFRPAGQYQWQFSTAAGDGRLAMKLDNDHALTVFDPLNPLDVSHAIVLHPGTDGNSGVFWNNQRLATASEVATGYIPMHISIGAGPNSLAIGGNAQVVGDQSIAIGYNSQALSESSVAVGDNAYVGSDSIYASAVGTGAVAIGKSASAFGSGYSVADFSTAVGTGSIATGYWSEAFGGAIAYGVYSFATAWGETHADSSVAIGGYTALAATESTAIASGTTTGYCSVAIGYGAWAYGPYQLAVGYYNEIPPGFENYWSASSPPTYTNTPDSPLFIIGNGSEPGPEVDGNGNIIEHRSNAFSVAWNGNTKIQGAVTVQGGPDAAPATSVFQRDLHVQGVLRVPAAGDIGMGDFTAGTNPVPQP